MRLLHTSDWHLGKSLLDHPLLGDQAHVLEQLVTMVERGEFDLVVVAGDVFDRSIPPESAVQLLGAWLARVRAVAPRTPVVVIPGNHDSGARLGFAAPLIAASGVHFRTDPARVREPVEITTRAGERVQVWGIPFLFPGAMPTGGGAPAGQVEVFEAAVAEARAVADPAATQVLVGHCFAQGGASSESERNYVGGAALVAPDCFDGFDYVALGHLHRPQSVTACAHYSGSLLKYSFSEVNDQKGVVEANVERGRAPVVTRHRLHPLRDLRELTGTVDDLLANPALAEHEPHFVRVVLTRAELAGHPMNRLRQRFPHLVSLHNPASEQVAGAVPLRRRPTEVVDVVDDWRAFHAHVHGASPPDAVSAAFAALRKQAQEVR